MGDRSGEIELGGGLVTPQVPGLAQPQLHQPGQAVAPAGPGGGGPGGALRPGGGGDRVRKPHCAGRCGRPATGLTAGAD